MIPIGLGEIDSKENTIWINTMGRDSWSIKIELKKLDNGLSTRKKECS